MRTEEFYFFAITSKLLRWHFSGHHLHNLSLNTVKTQ